MYNIIIYDLVNRNNVNKRMANKQYFQNDGQIPISFVQLRRAERLHVRVPKGLVVVLKIKNKFRYIYRPCTECAGFSNSDLISCSTYAMPNIIYSITIICGTIYRVCEPFSVQSIDLDTLLSPRACQVIISPSSYNHTYYYITVQI